MADTIINGDTLSWDRFQCQCEELKRGFSEDDECLVRWSEPSNRHVTFRAGGPIGALAFPFTTSSLLRSIELVTSLDIPLLLLGMGSNTLIRDGGFPGVILKLTDNFSRISVSDYEVTVLAGTSMQELAIKTARSGLEGLEWCGDIPGTMGGGIFMNAGMNELSLSNVVRRVTAIDTRKGSVQTFQTDDCRFGYRKSRFQETSEVIVDMVFQLVKADPELLIRRMNEITRERRKKFPIEFPNAGSIFKRPPGNYAGALIEQAGLKGKQRGGAAVSPKHANFIINDGQATAADIEDLIEEIQDIIARLTSIDLQPEIRIYGLR